MAIPDSTSRFSDRVENYLKYRPSYPRALVDHLQNVSILDRGNVIADVGSGTGKLSEVFLERGFPIIGVEPNREMREAAELILSDCPKFESVEGTAETTGLPRQAIDLLICGQAFHWFNLPQTKVEWQRILAPDAWVALIWNERDTDSAFLADYEKFLHTYAKSYSEVSHRNIDTATIQSFFSPNQVDIKEFENYQHFDFPALLGRYMSSSYAYTSGDPEFDEAVKALRGLFEIHAVDNRVRFGYKTRAYIAQLNGCE